MHETINWQARSKYIRAPPNDLVPSSFRVTFLPLRSSPVSWEKGAAAEGFGDRKCLAFPTRSDGNSAAEGEREGVGIVEWLCSEAGDGSCNQPPQISLDASGRR